MKINFIPERTLQHESEFEAMVDFILSQGSIRLVLEIGTYEGGTAYAFAQIAEKVICVDKRFGSDTCKLPVYVGTEEEKRIIQIQGRSQDISTIVDVRSALATQPVDILFIDGDHHYQEACVDFWIYSQFVRDDGWIAFHDAINPACAVREFWADTKKRFEHWEFVLDRQPPEKKKTIWKDSVQGIGLVKWRKNA